ncbi:hypothetical protein PSACC_02550 [Paramicrosporidium saccamoebae]|uniref:Homologous recombination OB-fold protein OB-fold domain-containing protein n=1 Tax=Paramicrosporidium saccamoebae TaxID=1246581 RepID=A0A2H9TIN3_9FUNG|nr:hypothetical protein PSACC_02550 [Paramicrosporidium saccamoebae]
MKRTRMESSDDEEAILALLDEIDCMPPTAQTAHTIQAASAMPALQNVQKSVTPLSSEIDFMQDDVQMPVKPTVGAFEGPTIGLISEPIPELDSRLILESTPRVMPESIPRIMLESTPRLMPESTSRVMPESTPRVMPESIPRPVSGPIATSVPLRIPDFNDNLLQFLPYPFFPENFAVSDWTRNAHSIISNTKGVNLSQLTSISIVKTLASGTKCPLMLMMVREVSVNARDLGVTLLDESGAISATIHEKVLSTHKIRIHFGLALLVQDVTIFCLNEQTDRHLIITPNNLVKIYSNVHHV